MDPISSLSGDLLTFVFEFVGLSDLMFSLTLTNRALLREVENFAEHALAVIEKTHQVDRMWRSRLGMQACRRDSCNQYDLSDVSQRRLAFYASQTHLYSLNGADAQCWQGCKALCVSPDGKTLLSGGQDGYIRFWELSTKRCVRRLEVGSTICFLGYSASRLVSYDEMNNLCIWALDGTKIHTITADLGGCPSMVTVFDEIFCAEMSGSIDAYDILSGEKRRSWSVIEAARFNQLEVCGELLCCLSRSFGSGAMLRDEDVGEPDGVRVFNVVHRSDLQQTYFFHGSYFQIKGSSDGSFLVLGRERWLDVVTITSNCVITVCHSIPVVGLRTPETLLTIGSRIYVYDHDAHCERSGTIEVWNMNRQEKERTIHYPHRLPGEHYFPWSLVSNGRELFCGFNIGDRDRSPHTIKAYLL